MNKAIKTRINSRNQIKMLKIYKGIKVGRKK